MEESQLISQATDEIYIGTYLAIFRRIWWMAGVLSLGAGIFTLVVMLQKPNIYSATAVITPASDEGKQTSTLGALSSSFGIVVSGPSKVEDLETLFQSNDLSARVFKKHDLWAIVLRDSYDPKTGKIKDSWVDRLLGYAKEQRSPGEWDAIRAAKDHLNVFVNRKAGTVSVSFESLSPEGSASIVGYYLEEGKSRLQEEALERAVKNKKFIEEQIGRTVDPLTRDRLYSLYGQEVEREMLARNREQFGFKLIDYPRVPDRKSKPQRAKTVLLAIVLSFPLWTVLLGLRTRKEVSLHQPD